MLAGLITPRSPVQIRAPLSLQKVISMDVEFLLKEISHPTDFGKIKRIFKNPRDKEDYYTLKEILRKKPQLNCTESALLAVELFKRKGWEAFAISSISPQSFLHYPIIKMFSGIYMHTTVIIKWRGRYFLYDQEKDVYTPYIYWYIIESLEMLPGIIIKDFEDLFKKGIRNYKDLFRRDLEIYKGIFLEELDIKLKNI